MATLLIVEDDVPIATLVSDHLRRAGHDVHIGATGPDALRWLGDNRPALVVLDIMLPGLSGHDVCKAIRQGSSPQPLVLMLTARSSEADVLLGYELGADDYVRKPFGILELCARVEALLRLARRQQVPGEPPAEPVQLGSLRISPAERQVHVEGTHVALTPMEFDLLHALALQPTVVFTRQQLLERVWGYQYSGYQRTVDTHINRLRRKLAGGGFDETALKSVHGVGYTLSPTEVPEQ